MTCDGWGYLLNFSKNLIIKNLKPEKQTSEFVKY